ncbi:MAG: hypothetical protein QM726_09925 [Chitinophagaceae bacterium]
MPDAGTAMVFTAIGFTCFLLFGTSLITASAAFVTVVAAFVPVAVTAGVAPVLLDGGSVSVTGAGIFTGVPALDIKDIANKKNRHPAICSIFVFFCCKVLFAIAYA